ncbi:MAG: LAGLIDADG family homing endonuclease [Candidatus Heimdallarchaeota archaeon]|nr:LAGLIDADG family homing endonuclease [Candidatus Heimdallarchaeota archaeon]MBY8995047.1 LAGLIDADG family homing endonuclease [Candidatus Heimdallarchaeota archaeon]
MQWKTIILNYLEKGSLPFPIFRCCFELKTNLYALINETSLRFTSARGEAFTFPTRVTNKLAYLCGICNGDGNLRDYWIIIADETKEHIEFISNMLHELFSKKGKLMKTGGAWIVKLNLLWAVRLFNFLTDQAIDEPKYDSLREPVIFQQLGEPFRSLYWRGAFDADGSFKRRMSFSTMSETYAIDLQKFLSTYNISSKIILTTLNASQIEIPAQYKWLFAQMIGCSHLKKMKDFLLFLKKSKLYKVFTGINEHHLTQDKHYFDFSLLPTLQVLGLDQFLEQIPFPYNSSDKYRRYSENGVTIRKLIQYIEMLPRPYPSVMTVLQDYNELIHFRSSSSTPIRLPLQPSPEFRHIMSHLVPTARGATLMDTSKPFQVLVQNTFSLPILKSNLLEHRVINRFLTLYGKYELSQQPLTISEISSLTDFWSKKLE